MRRLSDPRKLDVDDLTRMNVPETYWKLKADGIEPESARDKIRSYWDRLDDLAACGEGLFICGDTGAGKSAAAAIVLRGCRSRGLSGYFVSVWDLREFWRMDVPFDDRESVRERCRNVDVLVLDGLRKEDLSERWFGAADISGLIHSRNDRRRITLVTTEMTLGDIGKGFPGLYNAITPRLDVVAMGGRDRRQEGF